MSSNVHDFVPKSRPCVIDFTFATGSSKNVKRDIKKESSKMVKGKRIVQSLRGREYENFVSYTSKKAWMTGLIWQTELKKLDQKLGKERKKICLICDNASPHKQISLQNIELVYLMPNSTATLQVTCSAYRKYRGGYLLLQSFFFIFGKK